MPCTYSIADMHVYVRTYRRIRLFGGTHRLHFYTGPPVSFGPPGFGKIRLVTPLGCGKAQYL